MCIDDPLQHHEAWYHHLFDTHPPLEERIAILRRSRQDSRRSVPGARRDVHPRPRRQRAALASLAHGRQLRRVPCARLIPASVVLTSVAVPAPSRSTSPGASRRAGARHRRVARRHRGRGRAAAASDVANVEFAVGDVYALEHPDEQFDVVHAHQVLQHVADPVAALREMRRVCRPDGVVAARDSIYARVHLVPARRRASTGGSTSTARSPRRTAASRTRAAGSARGRSTAGFGAVAASASAWCYAGRRGAFVVGRPVGRARHEDRARRTRRRSWDSRRADDLAELAAGWRAWAAAPNGWFAVLHGEVLATP